MQERTLILGLGNDILRDDGVGLVAARRVAALAGGEAELREACVATVDLIPLLSGYGRVIVIDAYLSATDVPGTAVQADPQNLPRGFGYRSFHTFSFRDMLALGRVLGFEMPERLTIHGLCVEDPSTFGTAFTPAVAEAWRGWADRITRTEFPELAGAAAASTTPAGSPLRR